MVTSQKNKSKPTGSANTSFAEEYVEQLSKRTDLAAATPIITASGPIDYIPGLMRIMPPEVGFLRLLQFHRRVTGSRGPFLISSTSRLSQSAAALAYGNGLIALLAQIAVIPRVGCERILDHLCTFMSNVGEMDGLEAVWLSALMGAQSPSVISKAVETFEKLGSPRTLGSGVAHVPFVDPIRSRLCFADTHTFSTLRKNIVRNNDETLSLPDLTLVAGQSGPFANGPLSRIGIGDADSALDQWFGRCSSYIQVTVTVGATIGGFIGLLSPPGDIPAGLVGAGVGGWLGGDFGIGMCLGDAVSTAMNAGSDTQSSTTSTQATDYSSGPVQDTQSTNNSDNSNDDGDKSDDDKDTVKCGGTGPGGYPSPDDPGGNDGGATIPGFIPKGSGLAAAFSLTASGFVQFGAFPQLDSKANIVSAGFASV